MPAITVEELIDKLTVLEDNGKGDLPVVFYLGASEEAGPMLAANTPRVITEMPYVKSQYDLSETVGAITTHAVLIPVDG